MRRGTGRVAAALVVISLVATACGTRVDSATYEAALYRAGEDRGGNGPVAPGPDGLAGTSTVPPAGGVIADQPGGRDGIGTADAGRSDGLGDDADRASLDGDARQRSDRSNALANVSDEVVGNVITVGLHVPVTGAAPLPMGWQGFVDFAVEYTNREAPIHGRQLRIVVVDDAYDAARGLAACRRLAGEDPVLVMGYSGPNVIEVCADYFNKQGIPYLMRGSYSSILRDRPVVFSGTTPDDVQALLLADYVLERMDGPSRPLGGVYEGFPGAAPVVRSVVDRLEAGGGQVVAIHEVAPRQADFSAVIQQLRETGAGIVLLAMAPVGVIKIAVQSYREGYRPTWVGIGSHWNYNMVVEAAGPALDGAISFSNWAAIDSSGASEFRQLYSAYRPGEETDDLGMIIWGWYSLARVALENAGPALSRAALVDALTTLEWRPPYWNPISYTYGDRRGSSSVTVFRADAQAGRWRQITDFESSF